MAAWRQAILEVIKSRSSGLVLDIGCHLGETLADIAAVALPGDRYIGVDANLVCAKFTQLRACMYPELSANVIHAAAWNSKSDGVLWRRWWQLADSSGTLRKDLRPKRRFLYGRQVELLPLDSFSGVLTSQITAAKIDVEGAELEVLDGMKTLMKRDRFPIIIEILDRDRNASALDHEERWQGILDCLFQSEYTLHAILKQGRQSSIAHCSISEPRGVPWVWSNRHRQDYVALPYGFHRPRGQST